MNWLIFVRDKVQKFLNKIPKKDKLRIKSTLLHFEFNPFRGDIEKMEGEENIWRQRIGNYRIFYEIKKDKRIIYIFRIERRTTKTYKKR
ncbi:type II toxin-antitoxin system RelE/ParE family toxin [Patescibacteria group bacterium]|nr:type II toxin-antitoxin system RelE/ParE family toxin [Patescibacteria group bacterium]